MDALVDGGRSDMKILALEQEIPAQTEADFAPHLKAEAT